MHPAIPDPVSGPVVLFDTDCVLCSGMPAFVLAHERDPTLRFAGAWSAAGLAIAAEHGLTRDDLHRTMLVVAGGKALIRSDAALEIARHLRAPWSGLLILRGIPRPVRDLTYELVARNRYRLFGRRDACFVVPLGQRHRFVGVPTGAGEAP